MPVPVCLISDGLFHPPLAGRRLLEQFLRGLPDYQVTRAASLEKAALTGGRGLQDYRALVLYFHHRRISPAALDAFEGYVRAGGGVVALHSASASFKQSRRYAEVLGGRFVRHGRVEPVTLLPAGDSPLFAGIPAFTLRDELYRHEYDPENRVHYTVTAGGESEPFAWTRRWGAGRVLYLAPGHTVEAMRDANLREIIRRGLAWACGEGPV